MCFDGRRAVDGKRADLYLSRDLSLAQIPDFCMHCEPTQCHSSDPTRNKTRVVREGGLIGEMGIEADVIVPDSARKMKTLASVIGMGRGRAAWGRGRGCSYAL